MQIEGNLDMLVCLGWLVIATLLGLWNNWIYLGSDGFSIPKRPNPFVFYGMAVVNCYRFFTFRNVISFERLMAGGVTWHNMV